MLTMLEERSGGLRSTREFATAYALVRRVRIQMLCNMETISRKVTAAIVSLETALRQAMTKVV